MCSALSRSLFFFFLSLSPSFSSSPASLSLSPFQIQKIASGRNDGGQLGVGPDAVVPKLSHPRGVRRWAALALSPGAGSSGCSPSSSTSATTATTSAAATTTAPPPPPTGHAAGVDGSGDVYTWGRNDHGQLGVPPGAKREAPARMSILKGWDVRAIACG